MKRRRHTPEQIVRKLREVERLLGGGQTIADAAKQVEISEQTYHRWRNQYGAMQAGDARWLHAERPNHVWALDFQFDQTADGRVLKLLNIVDEHTREALAIVAARRINADATATTLDRIVAGRGTAPGYIRCDNGPELTANALRDWCRFSGTSSSYIEPGAPWENPYVESFNGRLRDEFLAVEQNGLRQLDNTSVPVPFACVLALEVEDHQEAEQLLHEAFGDHRVRKSREFFRVSPQRVVAAMRLTGGRDVTPKSDVVMDDESGRALDDSRKRREKFNFDMVGITPGTVLHFRPNEETNDDHLREWTATVHSRRKIVFEGAETSLTAAANEIRSRLGLPTLWTSAAHSWYVDDESLGERRERMEREDDD